MKQIFLIFITAFTLYGLHSCKPTEVTPDPSLLGYDYAPIDSGSYWIYDVIRIEYDPLEPVYDTFELKEVIGESTIFNDEVRYNVLRYTRKDSTENWPLQPDSVWTVSKNTSRFIKVENNYRFIKLTFPVEEKKSWNGNDLNTLKEDEYQYINVGKSYKAGDVNYPQTLIVEQNNSSSVIDKDYRIEVYAKNIGLIYVEKEVLKYDQTAIGQFKIETGIRYVQTLKDYVIK
ncbi:MAG TPA: hypothetical protein VIK89_08940 [Cytophagaceae bacterium]